jgi:hypothetical protein
VRATAGIGIDGASLLTPRQSDEVHGVRSRSGAHVSNAVVPLRAFDWSHVNLARFEGGPVGALLSQAAVHERALAVVGLMPVHGYGVGKGLEDDRPRPGVRSIHVTQRHEGGRGGYSFDLDAPRLVYYRVYRGSGSGATLFTRLEYDQERRRLEVEFNYADTTILDQRYREVADEVEETVDRE